MLKFREWRELSISILKQILSAHNFLSIYLLILTLFNLFLLNLPFTNYLGYEFSVFNSVILVLLAGIFAITYLKRNEFQITSVKEIISYLLFISIVFVLLPLILSFISLVFSKSCSILDGLIFYTVLTVPAPLIGSVTGFLSFSISKKFGLILFIIILILIALVPAVEIFINPQIYFYNPIVGFFPGTIYDEAIEVDIKLVFYRLLNLIYFSVLLYLITKAISTRSKFILRIGWMYGVVVSLLFAAFSSLIGFSTSRSTIEKELNKIIRTENFDIRYSSSINDTLINVIALHHEYYYLELSKFFQSKPSKKISSLIFTDREQKRKLFGSENADIAKPWIPEIYTTADSYDRTLKHEIAHCFTGEFGSSVFKVADNFNPVLIEGAAMAADPIYDSYDLDYLAALAYKYNFKVNIQNLFSTFNFFKQPSSLGYIISGSFIKYLIERFGVEKFKEIYSDLDFNKHYNKELFELASDYEEYLKNKFRFDEASVNQAKYFFGRKSIFYKDCPRYIAKQLSKAWRYVNERKYYEAKAVFEKILQSGESYSAVLGLSYCLDQLNQLDKSVEMIKNNLSNFENTPYWYELNFTLADLLVRKNKIDDALIIYKMLTQQNPNRKLFILSMLRIKLSEDTSVITKYLLSDNYEKYSILKSLNQSSYEYSTFPFLIMLADVEKINYNDFLQNFSKVLIVNDYQSSYGLYKLSQFMCEKMDFYRAMKMAALALRYQDDASFNPVLLENFDKMLWLFKNHNDVITKFACD